MSKKETRHLKLPVVEEVSTGRERGVEIWLLDIFLGCFLNV
jgi:hypothetical protein